MRFVRRLAASRLLHFAVLGGLVFALAPHEDPRRVAIATRDLDTLHAMHASRLGLPTLTAAQAGEVDERAVEDEVLYREALRLGLDRGDAVVRQHLVQKMLLLAEDMARATRTPTDDDLRAFYEETKSRWTRDGTVRFVHVFAARRDSALALEGDARAWPSPGAPMLGEAFPASRDVSAQRESVAAVYGEPFAAAVFAQPLGEWSEPVESKLGWHLVRVVSREAGHPASYDEVKDALALEWAVEKRHAAIAAFLARAYERYDVRVDGVARPRGKPLPRTARRFDPSGED